MLKLCEVNEIVTQAASAALTGGAEVARVESEPTIDSQGEGALRITIVFKRGSANKIGDDALDLVVAVHRALREANEDRFPIIFYATEEELEAEAGADAES